MSEKPWKEDPAEERKLDKLLLLSEVIGPVEQSKLTDERRQGLREQFRLVLLYPGEFVAFRDHWSGNANDEPELDTRVLQRREVLRHSKREKVVQDFIAALPDEQAQGVLMEFVEGQTQKRSASK